MKVSELDGGYPKAALVNLLSISIHLKDRTHFREVQRLKTAAILNKDKGQNLQDPGETGCMGFEKKSSQVLYITLLGDLSPAETQILTHQDCNSGEHS